MRRPLLLTVALLCGAAGAAAAQFGSFGQNKVQYRKFEWQVARGPHVDLYFYPSERHLAAPALAYAEQSYDTLALLFGHEVRERIPLIVYASHSDFEQTNVLPFIPPEGLLGATDFLKRRVTLPFRGNFAEFRHTLRHEMVHVFQLSLAIDAYYRNARGRVGLPLWWTEGLAESWSGGQDARDEMVLRDIVLSGRLPDLADLQFVTSGIVYPLGGRIHRWLADTYGDWRIALFYKEYWRYDSFEDAMLSVYGRTLTQLSEEFKLAMRRLYYPSAMDHAPLTLAARTLATSSVKPAWTAVGDSGGQVFYVSGARGYITIRRRGLDGGRSSDVVVTGKSAGLESLHPFDSRIDPSRAGYLLFAAKSGDRDALIVWDLKERKVAGRYQFPELVSILSPVWAGDHAVIFSGLAESGVSNLYRVTLPEGTLAKLTDDSYQDLDPSVSPSGDKVVFASDRAEGGRDGVVNLFMLDLPTGAIRQITAGNWVDETPRWSDEGRIYYASSRDGVLNIFSVDTLGNGRRETSAWTGAFDPVYLPQRNALLVGGFHDLSWNIYYYPHDAAAQVDTFSLAAARPPAEWGWPVGDTAAAAAANHEPYRKHLSLDFAAGEAAVIPGVGGLQGAQFFLSDLLGDHFVFLGLAAYQGRKLGNILDNLNASALYLNQTHRLNWGVGAFRTSLSAYSGPLTISYREKTYGALGVLRYPLDRYTRIQAEAVLERSNRIDFDFPDGSSIPSASGLRRIGWIASNYLSYVRDNSLWLPSGPIDGGRFRITAGLSSDFSNSRFDSYLLNGDLRHYFRLTNRVAYAVRFFGWYSGGDRPRRINIGGTLSLRGYPLYGAIVGSRAGMINQELRFPLLNYLTLATPLGALQFPELQGALFFDLGKAWYIDYRSRALLGSYGISYRWALAPGLVLRLDWGRRFSDNGFRGYPLTVNQRQRTFLQFFFGYNY